MWKVDDPPMPSFDKAHSLGDIEVMECRDLAGRLGSLSESSLLPWNDIRVQTSVTYSRLEQSPYLKEKMERGYTTQWGRLALEEYHISHFDSQTDEVYCS